MHFFDNLKMGETEIYQEQSGQLSSRILPHHSHCAALRFHYQRGYLEPTLSDELAYQAHIFRTLLVRNGYVFFDNLDYIAVR